MIEVGKYNELKILRETSVGLFLGDDEGEDILLPNKYCPKEYEIGDEIMVYVYRDYAARKIATNLTPKINLHEFALLKVTHVTEVGAFLDWGMEKELMVPFKEQRQKMEEGRWYIVFMDLDPQTDRLFASNKTERYLDNNELTVKEGEEVELLVYSKSDLGYTVIVDNLHKGLIYENEVFKRLNIGDKLNGYVKKIREENKLDISLTPSGYDNFIDVGSETVFRTLSKNQGFMAVTDKSAPEEIYHHFGMSKKAFKKAVGALYKQKKISLEEGGIRLI